MVWKILFTPWRLNYIKSTVKKRIECFICTYLNEDNDDDNLVVYRSKHSVVLMNRYPYSRGHVLVAPKKHIPNLQDLNLEELQDYIHLFKVTARVIEKILQPDYLDIGINIGRVAGAGLEEHVHIHIIPRWHKINNTYPVKFSDEDVYLDLKNLTRIFREEIRKSI